MYCYSSMVTVIYENNFRVGPKQKIPIRRDRILSIRWISDFWKSARFRRIRIRNPSHPQQNVGKTYQRKKETTADE